MACVACVSMCKDERDAVDGFVEWMASQVDFLLIADNGSTDGTRERLDELARDFPLTVLDDPEVGYYQGRKTTELAQRAAAMGARWVIPADQDERWYSPHGRIADVLADYSDAAILTAKLYDHVATALDPDELDPVKRIGWRRRDHAPLPKVAVRPNLPVTIAQGNHSASYPAAHVAEDVLVVRHFPYRSVAQFVSKVRNGAAAYAATDLPEDAGKHWRDYGKLLESGGEDAIADVFRAWFWSPAPEDDPSLIFDPAPIGAEWPAA